MTPPPPRQHAAPAAAPKPPGPQLPGVPRWLLVVVMAYALSAPLLVLGLLPLWPGLAADWRLALLNALSAYVTMLLSLYGGLHWGLGLRYLATTAHTPTFHILWGPLPALLAWLAHLQTPVLGLTLLIVVLLLSYWVDHHTYPGAGLGPWLRLRLRITLLACLSCLLGLISAWA